ncbi:MAG: hypothetical protein MUE73_02320 [Planctomycetes bacterium]|jgi:dienelactone hydrolase|nr:hypothetical protein [Planctomycetota bacterium]
MLRSLIILLVPILTSGPAIAGPAGREKAGLVPPAGPTAGGPVGELQVVTGRKGAALRARFMGLVPAGSYDLHGNDGKMFLGSFTANRAGKGGFRRLLRAGEAPDIGWYSGRGLVLTAQGGGPALLIGVFPGDRTTLGDPPPGDPDPWPPPPPPPPPDPGPDPKPETRLAGVDGDGPFTVASAVVSLPAAPQGLAPNSSVVYWPGTAGGLTGTTGKYSPVVLIHGFSLRASNYVEYGRKLASWGFVVLVGDHQDPLFGADHEKEIRTALGYVDWLVAQDADSGSRFFGRLATDRFGIFGHSLGGGVSIVTATRAASGGRIKACAGIAPAALAGPGGAISADTSTGLWPPMLVLTGSEDSIVTPATSKSTWYAPGPKPKMFLRIDGHCHTNYSDSVLFAIDYNPSTCVSSEEQRKKTRLYLVSWFLHHLYGDTRVRDYVDGSYAAEDPAVEERFADV